MSKNIIIVECESTSLNYIRDFQLLGYNPIILEMYEMLRDFPGEKHYTIFGAKQPKRIISCKKYDDTLIKVKKLKPLCIISGADHGLELTMKLNNDLHLPNCNSIKDLHNFRDKYDCQLALKKVGLRYIHSELYKNKKEAISFFKKHKNKVVVKPQKGVSTLGVSICKTIPQLEKALALASNKNSVLTNSTPFLQELIEGDEFVVNTCSHNGVHKVTSCFMYHKKFLTKPVKTFIYDSTFSVSPTSKIMKPIVKYALDVLKAINYKYGLCHAEFKVDKEGPVLIEVNCRAVGSTMPYFFLDRFLGHHETNLGIKSYLFPNEFKKLPSKFKPISNGLIKHLIISKPIKIKKVLIDETLKKLPSFVYAKPGMHLTKKVCNLPATINLETTPVAIFLENKNKKQLLKDLRIIEDLEKNHIEKLFEIVK